MPVIETDPTVTSDTMMRMPSGALVDLLALEASDFRLEDIAESLSQQTRFLGHAPLHPTVAEHSIAVEYIFRALVPDQYGRNWLMHVDPASLRDGRRAALMHDASESFISDMPTPAKRALRAMSPTAASVFDDLDIMVTGAINDRFDTHPGEWAGLIHQADQIAYEYESAYKGWGSTKPPEWVLRDPYIRRCYQQHDGGLAMFFRLAAKLGIK